MSFNLTGHRERACEAEDTCQAISVRLSEVEELYRRYGSMVQRRAERLLGDREAARDVGQEVFAAVIGAPHQFRGNSSPVTFLYAMTTNMCLHRIRTARSRSRALALSTEDKPGAAKPAPSSPEACALLRRVLALLPEELCTIAIYAYVDNMSHTEIAELTGVSKRTIGNRLDEFNRLARAHLGDP